MVFVPVPTTYSRHRRNIPARQIAEPEPTAFILPETGYELNEIERRASIVTVQSTLDYNDSGSSSSTSSAFPVGAVVGGVVGGVVIVLIAGGLYWWWSSAGPKKSSRSNRRNKVQPTLPGRVPLAVSTKAAGAGGQNEKHALSPTSYKNNNTPGAGQPTPSVRSVSGGSESGLLANSAPVAGAAAYSGQQQQQGGRSPTKKGYQPGSGRSPQKSEAPVSPTKGNNYQPNRPSPLAAKAAVGPAWGDAPFVASSAKSQSQHSHQSSSPVSASSYESGSPFNTPASYNNNATAPANVYSLNAPPQVSPTKSAIPRHLSAGGLADHRLSTGSVQSDESHYSDSGMLGARQQSGEWGVSYEHDSQRTEYLQPTHDHQQQQSREGEQPYDPYAIRLVRDSGGNYPEDTVERYYRRTGGF